MFVDSHCHLDTIDLTPYDGDLDKAIQAAVDAKVSEMLCVCIDLENFPNVIAIAREYPFIYASVGLHPNSEPGSCEEITVDKLLKLADDENIKAIGETGLDYFYHKEDECDWQRTRFRQHIQAANEINKPIIIHTRDAREDTINIMKEESADSCGGVMHCFTETWEMAQAAMKLGFFISFSGIVTFKNAKQLQDVAKRMPLDNMLIETDSPYLAPVPHRGKKNEPRFVPHVAEFIAELRGETVETIAEVTKHNYHRFIGID